METIALLIRESSKFDERISSIAHMYQPGTNLKVFLLGGKHVKIHLQGPGLDLIASDFFEHLLNIARISISAAGLRSSAATVQQKFPKSLKVVTPKKLNNMLNECKRHVVF